MVGDGQSGGHHLIHTQYIVNQSAASAQRSKKPRQLSVCALGRGPRPASNGHPGSKPRKPSSSAWHAFWASRHKGA